MLDSWVMAAGFSRRLVDAGLIGGTHQHHELRTLRLPGVAELDFSSDLPERAVDHQPDRNQDQDDQN